MYIDASKLDFGNLSTSDFPEEGVIKNQDLLNKGNLYSSILNHTLAATVYALGNVNMILQDREKRTVVIINDKATDYDWNNGGTKERQRLIIINNFIFNIISVR